MYRVFVVILLVDAIVLMAAVLLQAGRGGGLASSFGGGGGGSDQLFGARQAGNLLTKTTWWSAGIFLGTAFVMQLYAGRGRAPTSILDRSFAPAPAPAKSAPAPSGAAGPTVPLQNLPTDTKGAPPAGTKAPDSKDVKKGDTKQPEPAKKP